MSTEVIKVLLVEDNRGDSWLIQQWLTEAQDPAFQVVPADRLSSGLERLAAGGYHVMLLDPSLPDSQGLETYLQAQGWAPALPVVILTTPEEEALGRIAVREGAQGYLVKGQASRQQLVRTLRRAILQHELLADWQARANRDDLTGLCDQRGFRVLADQHWKLAYRGNRPFLLIVGDMDGLKHINATLGVRAGDEALRQTAQILRQTFRDADIVARWGGDAFIILVTEVPEDRGQGLLGRLQHNLEVSNQAKTGSFRLALSTGAAYFDPAEPATIEDLIGQAEHTLTANKLNRRQPVTA